ncbi:MAG: DUF4368 domain-containing protein [Firmicutes bacterium]|nr:DUF4368 domain-containing protein [Bacillota bacterium]
MAIRKSPSKRASFSSQGRSPKKRRIRKVGLQSADEFIRNIKKYLEVPELTREMCYELIDRIIVGGSPNVTGKERMIDIVYKVDIASVLRHKLKK